MTCTLHVAWDEQLAQYDFGAGHPMAPVRVELTIELARALGVLDQPGVSVRRPEPDADAELELVHDPAYLAAVRRGGAGLLTASQARMFGLDTEDDPVFPGMHEAAALVAGATLAAARAVWTGDAEHGASIAGGLHHAMRANASGFCVYNDPATAIAWLLAAGAKKIAYVDLDVHHGDGVQSAFYNDPRVLTISLHETPALLFPGTGLPSETGGPGAAGLRRERRPARRHRRRRLATRLPRHRPAPAGRLRTRDSGQPARLRHPRWPTSSSPSTASARPTPPSTGWPTSTPAAAGCSPAAAATSWSGSSPGPGPTCWPRRPAPRSNR